jgi:outer membrane protein OmpA-like peptidoglycan-associated protein
MKQFKHGVEMSTDNDDAVPLAMFLAAGVAAAVIAGVIAIAVFTKSKAVAAPAVSAAPVAVAVAVAVAAAVPAPQAVAAAAAVVPANAAENLYFAVGSADLPTDASEKLARVADAARANAGTSVLISGYHDATGSAAKNAELAKLRAVAVRHALEANGVAPDRLQMSKPVETTGGTDPKEARRVEMRLQ